MTDTIRNVSKQISIKDILIGFLAGVCLMLLFGATLYDQGGPFECCAAGDDSLSVFVMDRQTGHVWRLSRTDTYDYGTPVNRKSVRSPETPMRD